MIRVAIHTVLVFALIAGVTWMWLANRTMRQVEADSQAATCGAYLEWAAQAEAEGLEHSLPTMDRICGRQ